MADRSRPYTARLVRRRGFPYRLSSRPGRMGTAALALLVGLVLGLPTASAQTDPVCTDTPTSSERIECTEDSASTNDIDIDAQGVDIDTTERTEPAIKASHAGQADINVDLDVDPVQMIASDVDTGGDQADGISASHAGTGNIDIDVRSLFPGTDTITTSGDDAHGISAAHTGTGNVDIDVLDVSVTYNHAITTSGEGAAGIEVQHTGTGTGDVTIDLRHAAVKAEGAGSAYGILAIRQPSVSTPMASGDLTVTVTNGTIETTDEKGGNGISARNIGTGQGNVSVILQDATVNSAGSSIGVALSNGAGEAKVDVSRSTLTSRRDFFHAIQLDHSGATGHITTTIRNNSNVTTTGNTSHAVSGTRLGTGNVHITLSGSSLTTTGISADGIHGEHRGFGDILIRLSNNAHVDTQSTDLGWLGDTFSTGLYAVHDGTGNIDIDAGSGSITTAGTFSYGIYADHRGDGTVMIETHPGHTLTTTGPNGHGIVAYQRSTTADPRIIGVTVGGRVTTSGMGAQGVRVGNVSVSGIPSRVATLDADGYRQQTVRVNGSVMGNGAGVFLANGGRVVIGPQGSIGATSGIAILATGTVTDLFDPSMPPIPPKLRVDLNLGGRRVAQALGDDWIINDGGETTIAVNGTVLHDGVTGVTENTATNGAWDVTMEAEGVKVTNRVDPDPANWTVSPRASGVVADRDFSAQDFHETGRTPPPPPRRTPSPTPEPDPEPGFQEVYAPRAAVYEGLLGALLRLGRLAGSDRQATAFAGLTPLHSHGLGPGRRPPDGRLRAPGSPLWFRLTGGRDSHKPEGATVGAAYNARRVVLETGLDVSLGQHATGSISWYNVQGSVGVSALTGGGRIAACGSGVSAGLMWEGLDGFYSNGRLSATWFDVDAVSDSRGTLEQGVDALVRSLDLEAGRRVDLGEQTRLTARSWLSRTDASLQSFTDAVGARVSLAGADALTLGAGGLVETDLVWNGGQDALSLHGSLGIERIVGGGETVVLVSGEALTSTSPHGGVVLDVGATHRWGSRFTLDAQLRARGGVGSNDTDYAASLNFLMTF